MTRTRLPANPTGNPRQTEAQFPIERSARRRPSAPSRRSCLANASGNSREAIMGGLFQNSGGVARGGGWMAEGVGLTSLRRSRLRSAAPRSGSNLLNGVGSNPQRCSPILGAGKHNNKHEEQAAQLWGVPGERRHPPRCFGIPFASDFLQKLSLPLCTLQTLRPALKNTTGQSCS